MANAVRNFLANKWTTLALGATLTLNSCGDKGDNPAPIPTSPETIAADIGRVSFDGRGNFASGQSNIYFENEAARLDLYPMDDPTIIGKVDVQMPLDDKGNERDINFSELEKIEGSQKYTLKDPMLIRGIKVNFEVANNSDANPKTTRPKSAYFTSKENSRWEIYIGEKYRMMNEVPASDTGEVAANFNKGLKRLETNPKIAANLYGKYQNYVFSN